MFNARRHAQDFCYHKDGLGSVGGLADRSGNQVQSYVYDSFGNTRIFNSAGTEIAPQQAIPNPYAYTSREYDHEIGCYFYRNRVYCPSIGRFISEDPIGFASLDFNIYRYAGNNPIIFIDPYGLDFQSFVNRTLKNFRRTNQGIGVFVRSGVSIGAGVEGAVARTVGGLSVFAFIRGAQPLATPASGAGFTILERAIIAGGTTALNAAFAAGAFEAGVLIGSAATAFGEEISDLIFGGEKITDFK